MCKFECKTPGCPIGSSLCNEAGYCNVCAMPINAARRDAVDLALQSLSLDDYSDAQRYAAYKAGQLVCVGSWTLDELNDSIFASIGQKLYTISQFIWNSTVDGFYDKHGEADEAVN